MAAIWEQQENEPDSAYKRFLFYRNLGPLRSIEDAYNAYQDSEPIIEEDNLETAISVIKAPSRSKSPHVSGQWKDDSAKYRWEYRANQFDIHVLSQAGRVVIDSFYKALGAHSTQILETFLSGEFKPQSYGQLLEGLVLLGNYITPEAVEAWRAFASRDISDRK